MALIYIKSMHFGGLFFLFSLCCASRFDEAMNQMFPEFSTETTEQVSRTTPWSLSLSWFDEISLWNLGLVNKSLGYLVRSNIKEFIRELPDGQIAVLRVLASSELDLHDWMLPFFCFTSLRKVFGFKECNLRFVCPQKDEIRYIRARFISRVRGLKLLRFFYTGWFDTSDDIPIPSHIASDLYQCTCDMPPSVFIDTNKLQFYLPITEEKLFDHVDPFFVCQVHWSQRADLNQMFMPALMSDYIIPCMRGELVLNERERYILRVLMKYQQWIITPYFDDLFLASRLNTDLVKAKIHAFLDQLGPGTHTTGIIIRSASSLIYEYSREASRPLDKMYAIALQAGLDLYRTALLSPRSSPDYQLTRLILEGNPPEHILNMASMDIFNICSLCYNTRDLLKI